MANPCTPCSCVPYINRWSCSPFNGIWITMPQCHLIPGQTIPVNNPCFDGRRSYWSYKFFIDCSENPPSLRMISFGIPICDQITADQIAVYERIDGCRSFEERSFVLKADFNEDNAFKTAPEGFQYLIVDSDRRYTNGVCVEYRIELAGNYPEAMQDIKLMTDADPSLSYNTGAFAVPGCPLPAEISITKGCSITANNGVPVLRYEVTATNTGGTRAEDVQLMDTIGFDGMNLTLGDVVVSPSQLPLRVVPMPSMIQIAGPIGDIEPESSVTIAYTVPVVNFNRCGIYQFTNIATIINNRGIFVQTNCTFRLEARELTAQIESSVEEPNHIVFTLGIQPGANCPTTEVTLEAELEIPEGITVEIVNLGSCTAEFDDGTEVTEGTMVTGTEGGTIVLITCSNLTVPENGVYENIELDVLCLSIFGRRLVISGTITDVIPEITQSQVFLRTENVPVSSEVVIRGNITL
jgi:hypothetical protein